MEKWMLRKAFEDYLPTDIVWRQKEQFSDGVGYSWIDTLRDMTSKQVSDEDMRHAAERFPINPPMTKEEYYYRSIYSELFPSEQAALTVPSVPSVACSTAEAIAWDASFKIRSTLRAVRCAACMSRLINDCISCLFPLRHLT